VPRAEVTDDLTMRMYGLLFGDRDPVGRRVEVGFSEPPAWLEIVGVVTDTKGPSLEAQPDEQVFVPLRQQEGVLRGSPALSLVVRGRGDPAALAEGIRQAVWKLDRAQPLHLLKPMTQIVEEQTAQRRFTVTVLGVFAGTAVLLAALGLYGVMSSGVTARTRELGIRLALGSQRSGLLGLVLRRGAALTSAGIALGWLGALAGSRLLRSLLFGIEPMDPVTFGLVPLLLALVALVACWIPARRASRVDPMVALRAE
jgi:putative ABC transport system permease protein